ncbi:MAG: cytochrome c biogenesis protein CcsA [Deltaproteobacteria bacterium]
MSEIELLLSRTTYLLSVELRLFWLIAFVYGISFLLFILHILTRSTSMGKAAHSLMWANALLHVGLIVFRTFEAGRAPFQTLYETLSWFAASAALTYLIVAEKFRGVYAPGALVSGLSMGACMYALVSRSPSIEPLSPPLQSYWFEWHVILAFFSYAVFVVSASIEATYLAVKPLLTRSGGTCLGLTMDTIERFRSRAFKLVLFGYPLLTFAVFSGAAWANDAWGRYWSWDPKETWSLITWTVFTMYLHSMTMQRFNGRFASALNILGFVCMMMTFLGVNWLAKLLGIPSLHVYAV